VSKKTQILHRAYGRHAAPAKHEGGVKTYDDAFLACRAEQHQWSLVGYYRLPDGVVGRLSYCDRCTTVRRDRWVKKSGERLPSSYVYPDGYQIAHNGGSPASKGDMRLETMRRVDLWANEDTLINSL
jgi:hypothetical protein